MQAHRYALYLAPPEPWRTVGSRWLGRCAETGQALPRPPGADPRLDAWTDAPRRYGLHATLKPPFRLGDGASPAALDAAVRTLARSFRPFEARLRLRSLRGFLAWCLDEDDRVARQAMRALADTAVAELDCLRAPPTQAELARRQPQSLDDAQRERLVRWGYPHVFDGFTFHITLTACLQDEALAQARRLLAEAGAGLPAAIPVGSVSVYVQPAPGEPFLVARHYGFDGRSADAAGARWLARP